MKRASPLKFPVLLLLFSVSGLKTFCQNQHPVSKDTTIRHLRDSLAWSEKWRMKYYDLVNGDFVENERRDLNDLQVQQRLLSQLAERKNDQRNWAIAGGTGIAVLLSLIFYQTYRRRQSRNALAVNLLQNKVLRSQLNPHFIFNALSSVRRYIKQYPELAESYLIKFSILMRQVLENSREEKISLQEEIAMLENYMQLEALRLPHGFDYEFSLDESADAANTMIPPMILQPMVENTIWHGLNPLNHRGKISFQFRETNHLLEVSIEDNGIGLGSASAATVNADKKRSLGIQITRERIELLNRKAKSKGSLKQQLLKTGSTVKVVIPL